MASAMRLEFDTKDVAEPPLTIPELSLITIVEAPLLVLSWNATSAFFSHYVGGSLKVTDCPYQEPNSGPYCFFPLHFSISDFFSDVQ
ncbi:hypothetical protein PIB30_094339 [Stylosanthes scabra]|uniref:Uncharacterized protein n=1 Tax=Stylosanthes scabra TaxID=79078 RepID=A0ABU6QWK0_9FABA|nr:hypothetical protein [Stylosanthes scabra]